MKVKNRTHKLLMVILVMISFAVSGCRKVKDISVTSVELEAVSPQGFKGLNVYVAVGIDNPAFQIGLEDIQGTLKYSGKIIGRLAMDPFIVQARSAEIYHLRGLVTLGEEATLRDLMMLMDAARLNECMVDVSLKARLKNGVAAPINVKDIPLKKLLDSTGNEQK
ncbi:MAG: hypothetical protein II989_02435 [Bacteroidales bacterium]|nr:hypothetical protein [Bacteroidales bacterium]